VLNAGVLPFGPRELWRFDLPGRIHGKHSFFGEPVQELADRLVVHHPGILVPDREFLSDQKHRARNCATPGQFTTKVIPVRKTIASCIEPPKLPRRGSQSAKFSISSVVALDPEVRNHCFGSVYPSAPALKLPAD